MIRRLVVAFAVFASALGTAGSPVHAADFDFAECGPSGLSANATYSPGVTATTTNQDVSLSVSMTCTGPADEAGSWTLSFDGTGDESCAAGRGSGSVTGVNSTTGESWTLPFTYVRDFSVLYVFAGPAGPEGQAASLGLVASDWIFDCPTTTESFTGIGAVGDTAPPAGVRVALGVNGSGVVSSGYPVLPLGVAVTWHISATAGGVVNGVPATCSLVAQGTGVAVGMVEENGAGRLTCTSVLGVGISCPSLSYGRIGNILQMGGSCTGSATGTMEGRFALTFNNFDPTTSFNVQGTIAIS